MTSLSDYESRIESLDVSLYDAVLSGTSEDDRLAMLLLQRAIRNAFERYTYLEIGSHLGGSIQPYLVDPRCQKIYSIDKRPDEQPDERGMSFPYPNNSTARMMKLLSEVAPDAVGKIQTFEADARDIDPSEIDGAPQICFIDGEHTNRAAVSDFEFCMKICAPNAIIAFHDANIVMGGIEAILKWLQSQGIKHSPALVGGVVFAIGLGEVELVDHGQDLEAVQQRPLMSKAEAESDAWLLEPDPIGLAAKMREVVDQPEQAREKGRRGSEYVHKNLTWAHAATKAEERLRALQGKPLRREMTVDQRVSLGQNVDKTVPSVTVFALPGPGGARSSIERFTDVHYKLIEPVSDEGIAAGINAHLANVTSDCVALVRDDVIVTEGWLGRLMAHFEADEQVAVVVPRLPVAHGEQATRAKYKSTKRELQRFAKRFAHNEAGERNDIHTVHGACVVMKRDVLDRFGGFDGAFATAAFLDDFLRRCGQIGMKAVCAKDVFVHCDDTEPLEDELCERLAISQLVAGDVYRSKGEAEEALTCYRKALELKEDYLEAALVFSAGLLEEDQAEEAVAIFQKLVLRHPSSSRLRNYHGRCLYVAGDRVSGRAEFEKAIEIDPNFGEAYSNLGVLLWENGELETALEQMNRAAELAPESPDVIYNIGMIYAQLGQGVQAAEVLKAYLSISPDDLHARTYLAVLLLENGAEEEGVSALEYVLERDPNHEEALTVVADLHRATQELGDDE